MLREQYSKTFEIFQSSGMGKNRLVREISAQIMTLSYVVRPPGLTCFPTGDDEVYEFSPGGCPHDCDDTNRRALCQLGNTFEIGR